MPADAISPLDSVRALAQAVFGNEQAADEWLHSEALGLEFRKPIDLIGTASGVEAVTILLLRMMHGVYA